jgi:amino acid transporter
LNAVWLSCFIAFLLALPYLGNTTAYIAITSLSTICLYISYILPIVCKLLYPHTFIRGPFHLGRFSTLINIIAFIWVCCIVILFVLPPIYPVTAVTMNYASVGVGSVIIFAGLAYYLSAKYWFQGPITNLNFHTEKIDVFMRHL